MAVSEVEERAFLPGDVAGHRFTQARKGYAPEEVDALLGRVGQRIRALEGELERQRARSELLERKITSAQEAAYARVFRHLMEVMRAAEDAASRIRRASEDDARSTVSLARDQARRIHESALTAADRLLIHARDQAARAKATMLVRDATVAVEHAAVAAFDAPAMPSTGSPVPRSDAGATVHRLPAPVATGALRERAAGDALDMPSFDDIGRRLQAHVVDLFAEAEPEA